MLPPPPLNMGIDLRLYSNTAAQIILIILLGEKIDIASHLQEEKSQINQIWCECISHRYLHTKFFSDKIASMSYMSNIKQWEKGGKWESNIICTDKVRL